MSMVARLVKFGVGSVIGAGIGAAVGTLTAPDDGQSFQSSIRRRLREAKDAGARAQADKQAELTRKYRGVVEDPDALVEEAPSQSRAEAVVALGLGLNAPGAIAAQQAADRDADDTSFETARPLL